MRLFYDMSRFLFGAKCLSCGSIEHPLDPWLCKDCRNKLSLEATSIEHNKEAFSFYNMGSVSRKLVHSLKYKNMPGMASYLVKHSKTVLEEFKEWLPPHDKLFFVPVPLHPSRFRERGYNQTEKICRALSTPCNGKIQNILARRHFSISQTKLSKTARAINVAGAFYVKHKIKHTPRDLFVVVDDVYTTGATTSACLYAMRRVGIENVRICTMLYERTISAAADFAADNAIVWELENN